MHRAREVAAVLLVLAFATIVVGLVYGAVTTGEGAIAGGWVILGIASAFTGAALISLIMWRLRR
jgi:uncharacterized ion transporter superfamily protein YfcC